ncbi:transmembrane protein 94-like, partial [Dendronephthya gigantea]|uniref:transmembrane protein 94-like n=1 Tax=Dendronephthya gigantea TaxID=151771 RepID=UPI00106D6E43
MATKSQKRPLFGSLGDSENGTGDFGEDEGIELENVQKLRNEEGDETIVGLSCDEAYRRFCGIIRHELTVFNQANNIGPWRDFVRMLANTSATFNFISLGLVLLQIFLIILGYAFQESRKALPMVELSIIVAITALNIVLGVREERLRKTELSKKIAKFLTQCQAYRLSCPWSDASYPHLATPSTDSLSLVWTYRKNRLVNVPANLLVEGDVIVLGPGQKCPAKVQLKSPNGERIFDAGEIYRPENEEQQAAEHLENERLFSCQPCPRQKFTVVEAPLEGKLRTTFYSSQRRPTSLLDNERCYVIKQVLQFRVIPVF